ncbi:MAG: MaoC/PaaZ C-terminal domain-containing protein [Thermodesulfobacteriota bacterium]
MYFEDFEPGRVLGTPARTVTAKDLDDFLRLSWLDNPIFTSPDGAAAAGHAGRIVPAPFQLAMAMGLAQQAGIFDHVVAVLEFDRLKFHRVVHPGHTLRLGATVLVKRETSQPGRGVVILEYEMKNQEGQTVMTALATYLMRRRED